MNFVQISDVHFDIPFTTITERADLGDKRRLEQRSAFKKAIDFVKDNNVEYLFITGDLYEQEYVRRSTIDFINNLFKQIEKTKIFIVPGNHDPYIKDSYYSKYQWAQNVKIFSSEVEKVEYNNVCIYGYGFDNFEMNEDKLNDINQIDDKKINIFLSHGDIYNQSKYNYIDMKKLNMLKFDYIGIGHIHKRDDIYIGSLISLGFDELGEHGFLYGMVEKNNVNKRFISADTKQFDMEDLDITQIESQEELIEKINSKYNDENKLYEIVLKGYRKFQINTDLKYIKENIIKLKDNTKVEIQLNENNTTLKGIFIKKLREKLQNGEIDEEKYERILEIGISVLEKNK